MPCSFHSHVLCSTGSVHSTVCLCKNVCNNPRLWATKSRICSLLLDTLKEARNCSVTASTTFLPEVRRYQHNFSQEFMVQEPDSAGGEREILLFIDEGCSSASHHYIHSPACGPRFYFAPLVISFADPGSLRLKQWSTVPSLTPSSTGGALPSARGSLSSRKPL